LNKTKPHSWFAGVLITAFCLAAVIPWIAGRDFYVLSLAQRPFHPLFQVLKPSGRIGHGYGIAGSLVILAGVIAYSARKRFRPLASFGRMNRFLEFHIAAGLVGPTLIVYHATFKLGGLIGVGFWCMAAVVASGFIGRYLWVQIPRGTEGDALSIRELDVENERLLSQMKIHHDFSPRQITALDRLIDFMVPAQDSFLRTVWAVATHDLRIVVRRRELSRWLAVNGVSPGHVSEIRRLAGRRSVLHRRILLREQLHRVFRYWHVIHLPFAAVLLVIFLVHVATAVLFGYTWGG
jgi:hypothetical protein